MNVGAITGIVSAAVALAAFIISRIVTRRVRVRVHRAFILEGTTHGPQCYFVNITNLSHDREVEVTHVWLETSPPIYFLPPERPLPKRLKGDETWETWVPVSQVRLDWDKDKVYTLARVRISSGKVFRSKLSRDVPSIGIVPGSPPQAPTGTVLPANTPNLVPHPHFAFSGLRYKALFVSPDHKEGVVEPMTDEQESHAVMGVTLSFTNVAAGSNSKRAINVVARIRFYSADWSKSRDIPYGVWLNSPCNCTEMEVGAVEELVLILVNGTDYGALRDVRVDINKEYPAYFKLENVPWFSHVRVKLTDQISGTSAVFALRIWHDGKGWCHHSASPPAAVENTPW